MRNTLACLILSRKRSRRPNRSRRGVCIVTSALPGFSGKGGGQSARCGVQPRARPRPVESAAHRPAPHLEERKVGQVGVPAGVEEEHKRIQRQRGHEVDQEPRLHIMHDDLAAVANHDRVVVDVGRPERDDDIERKQNIDHSLDVILQRGLGVPERGLVRHGHRVVHHENED